jgi:hypothetical protein
LNHVPGNAINPQRAIAADANTLISLPLSEHSGHGRTRYWLAPVANDPKRNFATVNCRIAKADAFVIPQWP